MGLHGFGHGTRQQVDELNKALSAGYVTDRTNMTGGNALRVESLEESLKVLTFTDRHLKLWPKIHKSPAYSTVEEYNQLTSYGNDFYGPFIGEGQTPQSNDSNFQRKTALVKFMGTTREVSHQATLVHPAHGDLIALENQNGIMWLLRQIEVFLFKGNRNLAFSGESVMFDGLDQLIDSSNYLDVEGSPLQESDFEEASNLLAENYAFPTDAFLGFRPMSDLVKTFYPRHRVQLPSPTDGRIGQAVTSMSTQAGVLNFNADVFIQRPETAPDTVRGPSTMVPTAPAGFSTLAVTVSTDGEFDKSQGADDAVYGYKVSACNQYGESVASVAAITPTLTGANAEAGHVITFVIKNAAALTNPPEYFNVYRTLALTATTTLSDVQALSALAFSRILQVRARSQAANGLTPASPGVETDKNQFMPFTEMAYVGELSPQVITCRQLAPLMKIDLALQGPVYRWMILAYMVPILFAPLKFMRILNIGRLGS